MPGLERWRNALRFSALRLLTQLPGFGAEKHDDAVDTLTYLILGVAGDAIGQKVIHYV